jgi:protein-L-isoaspartate O-methyltransferase
MNQHLVEDVEVSLRTDYGLPRGCAGDILNAMMEVDRGEYVEGFQLERYIGSERIYEDRSMRLYPTRPEAETACLFSYFSTDYIATPQPSFLAYWMYLMGIGDGQRVLEVGTGTGYQCAIAFEMIQPGGELVTIDIDVDISRIAKANLSRSNSGAGNIKFLVRDGMPGYPEGGPFDKIYFTFAFNRCEFDEEALIEQLNDPGTLSYPIHWGDVSVINLVTKNDGKLEKSFVPGPRFKRR